MAARSRRIRPGDMGDNAINKKSDEKQSEKVKVPIAKAA
jgi:hypothetical protein